MNEPKAVEHTVRFEFEQEHAEQTEKYREQASPLPLPSRDESELPPVQQLLDLFVYSLGIVTPARRRPSNGAEPGQPDEYKGDGERLGDVELRYESQV